MAKIHKLFSQKISIIDVCQAYKYVSADVLIHIFIIFHHKKNQNLLSFKLIGCDDISQWYQFVSVYG